MNIDLAKQKAINYIKEIARDKEEENTMLRGLLVLEDAIKGDI